ncbi:MAG: hypothetical protein DRP85_08585, partial [Candidatus Makaraimicrobium thalassicum]
RADREVTGVTVDDDGTFTFTDEDEGEVVVAHFRIIEAELDGEIQKFICTIPAGSPTDREADYFAVSEKDENISIKISGEWNGKDLTKTTQVAIARYTQSVMPSGDYKVFEEVKDDSGEWVRTKTFYKLGKGTSAGAVIYNVCKGFSKYGKTDEILLNARVKGRINEALLNAVFNEIIEQEGEEVVVSASHVRPVLKRAHRIMPAVIEAVKEIYQDYGAKGQTKKVSNPFTREGKAAMQIIVCYAARDINAGRIITNKMQLLSAAKVLFSQAGYPAVEKKILDRLEAEVVAIFTELILDSESISVTIESFLRNKIWSEAHNLIKGPAKAAGRRGKAAAADEEVTRFSKETADIWQKIINIYLNAYRKVAYEEFILKNKIPQEYLSYLTGLRNGVLAKLEAERFMELSRLVIPGTHTFFKGMPGEEGIDGHELKLDIENRRAEFSIPPDMRDMTNRVFTASVKTYDPGSANVRVTATSVNKNNKTRTVTFIMKVKGPSFFSLPRIEKEDVWQYLFFVPVPGDYRYEYEQVADGEEGFDFTNVENITVEMIPQKGEELDERAEVIIRNPSIVEVNIPLGDQGVQVQPQPEGKTISVELTDDNQVSSVAVIAKVERRLGRVDEGKEAVLYHYMPERDPETNERPLFVNISGKEVEISGTVPYQADRSRPLMITLIDLNGNLLGSEVLPDKWKEEDGELRFTTRIEAKSTAGFDATKVAFIEARFEFESKKPSLWFGVLGSVLFFVSSVAFALIRVFRQYKRYLKKTKDESEWPRHPFRKFIKAVWRQKFPAKEEKKERVEGLGRERPEAVEDIESVDETERDLDINAEDLSKGLGEAVYAIRDWVDDMKVDFRQVGKQQEDEGIFLPFMRFSEIWQLGDPMIAPRYSLNNVVRGIGAIALAAVLYQVGFAGFLTWLYPFAILFTASGFLNWMQVFRTAFLYGVMFTPAHILLPLLGMTHPMISLVFSTVFLVGYMASPFVRYCLVIKDPQSYVKKQKEKLAVLHSILHIIQNGDESLKRVAAKLGDTGDADKDELLALADDERLGLSGHAKNYIKARASWYQKRKIKKKDLKRLLWTMATFRQNILPYVDNLKRWRRSHAVEKGAMTPGGDLEETREFSGTLEGAVEEAGELSKGEIEKTKIRKPLLVSLAMIIAAVPVGVLVFLKAGVLTAAGFFVASLLVSVMVFTKLFGREVKKTMIIDPAKDMKKIFRENFRIIYVIRSGYQLQALNVWRSLTEIKAAISRESQEISEVFGEAGRREEQKQGIKRIIQRSLNRMRIAITNVRDTAIVRGFFDSFHLSENETWPKRLKVLARSVLCLLIVSVAIQLLTFGGMYVLGEAANFILSGGFAGLSGVFNKPFAVVEILKAGFMPEHAARWYFFAFSQTLVFGTIVIGGLWLALGKFAFYFLGDYAKLYPEEKVIKGKRFLKYGVIAAVAALLYLVPGVHWSVVLLRVTS